MRRHFSLLLLTLLGLQGASLFGQEREFSTHAVEESPQITADEYCEFLNTEIDTQNLYDEKMGTNLESSCIARSGVPGNYHYEVISTSTTPMIFISLNDLLKYCAWHNHLGNNFLNLDNTHFSNVDPALRSNLLIFCLVRKDAATYQTTFTEVTVESEMSPLLEEIIGIAAVALGGEGALRDPSLTANASSLGKRTASEMSSPNSSISIASTSQRASLKKVKQPHYRLGPDGWEKQSRQGWKATAQFSILDLENKGKKKFSKTNFNDLSLQFIEKYNRADDIDKKTTLYEKELEELKQHSASDFNLDRTKTITALIAVLKKASAYQKQMINHLRQTEAPHDERIATLKHAHFLRAALKINDTPNKAEQVAEQIEKDYQRLIQYRERFLKIEDHLREPQADSEMILDEEKTARALGQMVEAIKHQCQLIDDRLIYATSLRSPHEEIDLETQQVIQRNQWRCVQKEAEAQRKNYLAQRELSTSEDQEDLFHDALISLNSLISEVEKADPNEEVFYLCQKSLDLYQEVLVASDFHSIERDYLHIAGNALFNLALEIQKLSPNQEAINFYRHSADLYQQAAATGDLHLIKRECLSTSANALFSIAVEIQKLSPNQEAIRLYTTSANFHQQAALEGEEMLRLYVAGNALFNLALEIQKPAPHQEVIELLYAAADLSEKSVGPGDLQLIKRECLWVASSALLNLAVEVDELEPHQEVIKLLRASADLSQQAAAIDDLDLVKIERLYIAGSALFNLALETQKPEPDQELINLLRSSASLSQQAANERISSPLQSERLYITGSALFNLALEIQKPLPNQEVIKLLHSSVNLCQETQTREGLQCRSSNLQYVEREFLNIASKALLYLSLEIQKPTPNQETIKNYRASALQYQEAAEALSRL